jgi:hypothetical protein
MENFKNFMVEGWFDWLKKKPKPKPSDSWPGGIDRSNEPTVRAGKTPVDQSNIKTSIGQNPNYAFHGFGQEEPRRKINQDVDKNQVTIYIKQLENMSRNLTNLHDFMVNQDNVMGNEMPQSQETFSKHVVSGVDGINRALAMLRPLLHDEELD